MEKNTESIILQTQKSVDYNTERIYIVFFQIRKMALGKKERMNHLVRQVLTICIVCTISKM